MQSQKLELLPLLRQINALDLPVAQRMVVYPWAVLVCAISSFAQPAAHGAKRPH